MWRSVMQRGMRNTKMRISQKINNIHEKITTDTQSQLYEHTITHKKSLQYGHANGYKQVHNLHNTNPHLDTPTQSQHAHTNTHKQTHTQSHTHAHTKNYTHTHTHAHTHTYTQTHT